jgi:hypothetical protein
MTDNEIEKALECCKLTNEQQESRCDECPLWETSLMICQELLAYHALGLINRQKAEIEEHKRLFETIHKEIKAVKALYIEDIGKAKAEAIKEFAERLKENIDCIAQEMTEETTNAE